MKTINPHIVFWISAIVVIAIGLFSIDVDDYLTINIHDTYFVISRFHLASFISIVLAFIGLVYYLHYKFEIPLFRFPTKLHVIITMGCLLVYLLNPLFQFKNENDFPLLNTNTVLEDLLITVYIIGLCIQILFISNSVISLVRHFSSNIGKL